MVDHRIIDEVREKIKETVDGHPMIIENEPDHSGDTENIIGKDEEEKEGKDLFYKENREKLNIRANI